MFRSLNRTYLALCVLLIGTCSSVFAIDFSQAFSQAKEQSSSIGSFFEGKAHVSNLYAKALKLVKDREVNSAMFAFDKLMAIYKCSTLTNADFINVLFHTNISFKTTFIQIFPKHAKRPSDKEVDASYQRFFACKGITGIITQDTISAFNNTINDYYYTTESDHFKVANIDQVNYGSDLFRNGTTDDSDFDLLSDINQIGSLLFDGFQESPDILFYRLPEADPVTMAGGGDLSSLSDQGRYQVGGTSSPSVSGSPSSSSSSSETPSGSSLLGGSSALLSGITASSQAATRPSVSTDKEVQDLIQNTKTPNITSTSTTIAGSALVLGNQCLSGDTAQSVTVQEEVTTYIDADTYVQQINDFINNASTPALVNQYLANQFSDKDAPAPGTSTSSSGYAASVAAAYAEQAFGEAAPGTCASNCRTLPIAEQAQCEVSCAASCISQCRTTGKQGNASCNSLYAENKAKCDTVSSLKKAACLAAAVAKRAACAKNISTEEALCVSDCTCFLIAGPNGLGREKMEEMFRIKFCKVPVEKKTVSKGKKVFSVQAIFQEISDVLEGLRDSGQMVEFSKKKEFLDGNIKISLPDMLVFQIQLGFKPVYPQASTTIALKEKEQDIRDFSLGVMNMNVSDPTADDYNKYIVIADPVKNAANMEPAMTLEDINANIKKQQAVADAADKAFSDSDIESLTKAYQQQAGNSFLQNMVVFLQNNELFRNNLIIALNDMNSMALDLKAKINNAK